MLLLLLSDNKSCRFDGIHDITLEGLQRHNNSTVVFTPVPVPFHSFVLRCVALRCVALRCVALHTCKN